jgi:hypothetical protein
MAFLNVGQEHGNEPDAETHDAFQKMFIAALLLTGSAASAECSLLEGIRTLGQGEVSGAAVLHATLKAALVPRIAMRREGLRYKTLLHQGFRLNCAAYCSAGRPSPLLCITSTCRTAFGGCDGDVQCPALWPSSSEWLV